MMEKSSKLTEAVGIMQSGDTTHYSTDPANYITGHFSNYSSYQSYYDNWSSDQ